MIRRWLPIFLLMLLGPACGAYSAEGHIDVEEAVPEEVETLQIVPGIGPVKVMGTGEERITATARILAQGFRTEEEAQRIVDSVRVVTRFDGTEGQLRVEMSEIVGVSSLQVILEVRVPDHLKVDVRSAHDVVTLISAKVGSVSGINASVRFIRTKGNVDVSTSNAPVAVQNHEGALNVDTTNGTVRMRDVAGSVTAQTTHAPIDVVASPEEGGAVLLQSVGGDVTLGVPTDFEADFLGEARGGRVSVGNLPIVRTLDEPDRIQGVIGEGGGGIRIFTRNGNIAVNGVDDL